MPRQDVHPRTPFALASREGASGPAPAPPSDGRRLGTLARLLLLPFAALAAALSGLVYVVLLPICGIASIASAVAQASWTLVREALGSARGRAAPRS